MHELKARALIRGLLCLLAGSLAGLVATAVLPSPLAGRVLIAAVAIGLVAGGVVFYSAIRRSRGPSPQRERAAQPAEALPDAQDVPEESYGEAGTYLFIRVEKGNELPAPGFLASAVTASSGDWSWEGQQIDIAKDAMHWSASTKDGARIDVIEFPISMKAPGAAPGQVLRVLQQLKLAGPQVRAWEFLRSVTSGRLPYHLHRLSGVIIAVPQAYFRDEAGASSIERLFRTIGQATQAKFPAYIVFTGIDEITGCAEALARLARERPAALAEPIGYAFSEQSGLEDLRRATTTVADAFGGWLPFLLERENDSAESTLRLAESMRRTRLRSELAEKRQRLFELVPRLESLAEEIANRLQSLRVQWGTSRWGPELRAVLFSGVVAVGARAQDDVAFTFTHAEGTQRQRAFVARFLTEQLPGVRGGSARVLGPLARMWWVRAYLATAALALALILFIGVSAFLS
jgi:hypothetical protein